ncbi:putative bifunctional diguanylate cyclase/phosphodiesterase [Paracraurococcus lichenis]|uniref:EAL domain-containing protein n=1 Tax=Paracraurococcus lichenis TaxID=3064888 RepID=A0ABT9EBA3_9PROT|nr:EAL domain-containing protein [Paracraurococcus sp. LOR1-02]MDO9713384.1 EAL domain-containing protein [Paracraurococcus sp. LOR1-02]
MTIRASLITGIGVLGLLGIVQAGAALLGQRNLNWVLSTQGAVIASVNAIAEAQLGFERADRAAHESRRAADLDAAEAAAKRFRAEADTLMRALQRSLEAEEGFAPVLQGTRDWIRQTDLRLPGNAAEGHAELLREDLLESQRDSQQQNIMKAVAAIMSSAERARHVAMARATTTQTVVIALVLVSLVCCLSMGLFLVRQVLHPLRALTNATGHVAAGNLEYPVEGRDRADEVGEIATALDALRRGTLEAREVQQKADAERAIAAERIGYLAHHDSLTGLPNRVLLHERLQRAIAIARHNGHSVALLWIDLDRFKAVNDSFGHPAGDALLRELARRLSGAVRDTDTVARLGGDEFIVVQTALERPQDAESLAARLTTLLSEPVDLEHGRQAVVSASIGIAVFPEDGETCETLLANADLAMYRVKGEGRNAFAFFRAEMDHASQDRRALEQELQFALARGQLSLEYQPQVDMVSGRVHGFEALLRWSLPERGAVRPDVFIPVAEASGAIVPIGAWVLEEACREASVWHEPMRISVNVSTAQFQHGDFAGLVSRTLSATGLDPSRLEIEVTESMLSRDPVRMLDTLTCLRAMGVSVAMDDFGTGYSSLATLRAFPFDRLKIDRSFVQDLEVNPEAAAIVHGVLGLAKALSLPVVAEGVETEQQSEFLRTAGCAEAQGYLFGKPRPISCYDYLTHPTASSRTADIDSGLLASCCMGQVLDAFVPAR